MPASENLHKTGREQMQQNSRVIRRLTEGMVVEKCIQC
jgi:hypothetical protein